MDLFPIGIILHFRISFVRGAVKAGCWPCLLSPRSKICRTGRALAPCLTAMSLAASAIKAR